jgi:putative acyl-CoA dehydrogenase
MLFTELEPSVLCPISMTYAVTPRCAAMRRSMPTGARSSPAAAMTRRAKLWRDKTGLTMGMGNDGEAGRFGRARQHDAGGGRWGKTAGDSAFASRDTNGFSRAPMCGRVLILAQAPAGLTCFFLPACSAGRFAQCDPHPALKDKLGNKANASSEVDSNQRRLGSWATKAAASANPRDGHHDAPGLRAGHQRPDAPGPVHRPEPHGPAAMLSASG